MITNDHRYWTSKLLKYIEIIWNHTQYHHPIHDTVPCRTISRLLPACQDVIRFRQASLGRIPFSPINGPKFPWTPKISWDIKICRITRKLGLSIPKKSYLFMACSMKSTKSTQKILTKPAPGWCRCYASPTPQCSGPSWQRRTCRPWWETTFQQRRSLSNPMICKNQSTWWTKKYYRN